MTLVSAEARGGFGLQCLNVSLVRQLADGSSRLVLRDVQLDARPGASVLLMGATGSGKTTLLQVLAGLVRPTAGEVVAHGEPVSRYTSEHRDRWRRSVGFAFQRAELLDDLTAAENVLLPWIPRGGSPRALWQRCRDALGRVHADHLQDRVARELSVGEKQRVALARALVAEPRYLLLDEPTANQDGAAVEMVEQVIIEEAARGAVVVVASHDPRLGARRPFPQQYRLEAGQLTAQTSSSAADSRSEPLSGLR